MKPRPLASSLLAGCVWFAASLAPAQTLITPTTIDWLLDCPLPDFERLDPEVIGRTQCGTVSVPRDHARPGRGSLRLKLTRVGARDPLNREGVVFTQSGDLKIARDGTFAIHLASRWESYATPAYRTLVNRYDVIELSPRDLAQTAGVEQAARDMEYVRAQLGEAQLNFLGNAEATRLGSRYGTLFPERVARMVLVNTEPGEPLASGVEQLLLKEPTQSSALARDCVQQWLGGFLVDGRQPPPSARCLDTGIWE
ncbi:alpha/beta fold hydrolase [Pseudomonas sp. SDO5271_S396]